jgi:transposase-like protein
MDLVLRLEHINQGVRCRTRVVRIFPNEASCLRLVSDVLMEISKDWQTGRVYFSLNGSEERAGSSLPPS